MLQKGLDAGQMLLCVALRDALEGATVPQILLKHSTSAVQVHEIAR